MVKKNERGRFVTQLSDEKLDALEFCLLDKGLNLNEELDKFLQGLYKKHVPSIMKNYLDKELKQPAKEAGKLSSAE